MNPEKEEEQHVFSFAEDEALTEEAFWDIVETLDYFSQGHEPLPRASLTPQMLGGLIEHVAKLYGQKEQAEVLFDPSAPGKPQLFQHTLLHVKAHIPEHLINRPLAPFLRPICEPLTYDRVEIGVPYGFDLVEIKFFQGYLEKLRSFRNRRLRMVPPTVQLTIWDRKNQIEFYDYRNAELVKADPHDFSWEGAEFLVGHMRIVAASIVGFCQNRDKRDAAAQVWTNGLGELDVTGI